MITDYEQYQKLITLALNTIGAGSAGATTKLLHDSHQVSQWLNLANALNRGVFGTAFIFLPDNKKMVMLVEIWKIITNGSYIITTLDVNVVKTIFSKISNWNLTIPHWLPFVSFETSAIAGVLAGMTTLIRRCSTSEGSSTNKMLKIIESCFNLLCPGAAVIGGMSLFWTPGLDSKVAAPLFATLDGVAGTTNWFINKLWNPINDNGNIENSWLTIDDVAIDEQLLPINSDQLPKQAKDINSQLVIEPVTNNSLAVSVAQFEREGNDCDLLLNNPRSIVTLNC